MTKWIVRGIFLLGMTILLSPLVTVSVNAFNADPLLSGWGGFTTHWISSVVVDPTVREAALGSLIIAAATTAAAAVIGTLVVGFSSYAPASLGRITDGLTVTRIMLPEVVLAAGLIVFVTRLGIHFGTFAVIVGHTVWASAYFIAVASARRAGFDKTLEDAARDLGAPPFRVFRTIIVPDLVPGLVAGALIAFTFSFDDVVTSVFLSGPETRTLPLEILSRIRHGINPSINAIGLLVMVVMTLSFAAMAALGGLRSTYSSGRKSKESTS